MKTYEKECVQTFLEKQEQLLGEIVFETEEEVLDFLEDCFYMVFDSVSDIRKYWNESGTDIEGMSDKDILEAAEVFSLPSGKFMLVEA